MASNTNSTTNFSETSTLKDDFLNEILTCGICLSRMSSPCCLPCAHSFCRPCLLDYARNHNIHTSAPINSIFCPYCKFQVNFRSFEHFESILIINPILKQLCEVLDSSKINADSTSNTSNGNGMSQARCHSCCLLKMLKICKHCSFMLCETCRRSHLLDVHRESKLQLEILESRLHLINEKRTELDHLARRYDAMREQIRTFAERCFHEIEEQREEALRILNERQQINDETFWTNNGFDTGEKLDFFISLADSSKKKLAAKNITDKDLMEISDNLQTMPNIDEKALESIHYQILTLELDEMMTTKRYIRLYEPDDDSSSVDQQETDATTNNECIHS